MIEIVRMISMMGWILTTLVISAHAMDSLLVSVSEVEAEHPDNASFLRSIPNQAFTIGEELSYNVSFGFLGAGNAVMRVQEITDWKGRPCYRITSDVKSNAFFSKFFKVDDHIESIVDVDGIFPWFYSKRIREGKYKADRSAKFDPHHGRAFEGKDTLKVPPFTQDVVSIIYYARIQPLEVGEVFPIDNYADKKFFPLFIKVVKKEKIKVDAGKFECFYLEPSMRPEAKVEPKGKLLLWLTTDARHIPIRIRSKIAAGSLDMELDAMQGVVQLE